MPNFNVTKINSINVSKNHPLLKEIKIFYVNNVLNPVSKNDVSIIVESLKNFIKSNNLRVKISIFRKSFNDSRSDSDAILKSLRNNFKGVYVCFITNESLKTNTYPFIYGRGSYPVFIISTKDYDNKEIRELSLQYIACHEFGHALDLVQREFSVDENFPLHCSNNCVMHQVDLPKCPNLDDYVVNVLHGNISLCPDCMNELRTRFNLKKKLNFRERVKLVFKPKN